MSRHALDPGIIEELKILSAGVDASFLANQISLFSRRGRDSLAAMERAWSLSDKRALKSSAHALAGSAAVIGAMRLSEECLQLEERLAGGAIGPLQSSLLTIRTAFLEAEGLLTHVLRE